MGCACTKPHRDDASSPRSTTTATTTATTNDDDARAFEFKDGDVDDGARASERARGKGANATRGRGDGHAASRAAQTNAERVGTGMGRRSARALGESPRGAASASRVMTSPKKEASFGKSSGTALNAYASASHVRAVDDGVVGELADRRFSHGASKEKRAGGDGGLPPTSLSTRTTPIKGRGMSVDMDVVTQRASFQKYRGDEVGAASKDVIKGPSWVQPTKSTSIVAQARKRAMHKRTMSEEPGAFAVAFGGSTPARTLSGRFEDDIQENGNVDDSLSAEQFLQKIASVVESMRERHDFVRALTIETIELCKNLVELEAPVSAMLRLEEIDETSETGTFDGRATDFVAANEGSDCSFAGAAISSSAARNLAEEGFGEMMSASSPTPTTSGDFSLEAVEAELRSVRRLIEE